MQGADAQAELAAEQRRQRQLLGGSQVHLEAALPQRRGCLEADKAGAHDHGALGPGQRRDDPLRVVASSQREAAGAVGAGHRQPPGAGAGGHEQPVVAHLAAAVEPQQVARRVEPFGAGVHDHFDAEGGVEVGAPQREPVALHLAGEKTL